MLEFLAEVFSVALVFAVIFLLSILLANLIGYAINRKEKK
jgi:hypothetical protein